MLYIGCHTGCNYIGSDGTIGNLVDETFGKGAHYVMGPLVGILTDDGDLWMQYFLSSIEDGNSLQAAVDYATLQIGITVVKYLDDEGNETYAYEQISFYCIGDGYQYLAFSN